jgi:addiction module HigA family antidote
MFLPNIHPGEILLEDFLKPLGLSQNELARSINVAPRRINEIVLGKRGITADTSTRLGRFFGLSVDFWLKIQIKFELEAVARDKAVFYAKIERCKKQPLQHLAV